jgi:hypothetical protein
VGDTLSAWSGTKSVWIRVDQVASEVAAVSCAAFACWLRRAEHAHGQRPLSVLGRERRDGRAAWHLQDVHRHFVTLDGVRCDYGVIIDPRTLEVEIIG